MAHPLQTNNPTRLNMDKTPFGLKVAAIATLLASSILAVVIVAQRPSSSAPVAQQAAPTETKVSHK